MSAQYDEHLCTRRLEIDAAHRVPDHRSKCKNIHGHRYVIEAIAAGPLANKGEQRGMVVDFGFLKDLMTMEIDAKCDHGLILYQHDTEMIQAVLAPPYTVNDLEEGRINLDPKFLRQGFSKVYLMDAVPTAENLARHWYGLLEPGVASISEGRARIHSVRVHETPNCYADYPRR